MVRQQASSSGSTASLAQSTPTMNKADVVRLELEQAESRVQLCKVCGCLLCCSVECCVVSGWGGHMGEVLPSCAFLKIFFCSFSASTAYPEKRGFSLSSSKNVFRWWVCSFGVDLPRGSNLPFFCPPKPFFKGRIRLSFCMGVNRKCPLWLMIAP